MMTATRTGAFARLRHKATPVLLLSVAVLALAGCDKLGLGKSDKAPTGQVVATLDGSEITTQEVRTELQSMALPPTMKRHDAERLALSNIITRRMLAKDASDRKLDKTPTFAVREQQVVDQLRVQALARDIAAKTVKPTRDEAVKFIRDNPDMFANRKFYILDQIQFLRPDNIDKLGFESADTMAAVEAILKGNNIQFRRQPASLDALMADPTFIGEVTKVLAKNPNEVFMFASRPQGAPAPVILVNQVKEVREQPFTGDKAIEFATDFLRNQRIQTALKAEVDKLQKSRAERVSYQKGWEPPAPAKAEEKPANKIPHASAEPMKLPGGAEGLNAAHEPQPADDAG